MDLMGLERADIWSLMDNRSFTYNILFDKLVIDVIMYVIDMKEIFLN